MQAKQQQVNKFKVMGEMVNLEFHAQQKYLFKMKINQTFSDIQNLKEMTINRLALQDMLHKGSPQLEGTIIANEKMDQYKRIKSTGDGDYMGKYMRYDFFI